MHDELPLVIGMDLAADDDLTAGGNVERQYPGNLDSPLREFLRDEIAQIAINGRE
jgi:hypothetical protein